MAPLHLEAIEGAALMRRLDDLAALRIQVFAEYPYLYDGDSDYERAYLATYAQARGALLVGAFDEDRLVGGATGLPMEASDDGFAAPLKATGIAPETVFYCGESVLLPAYRGRGIGHRFFDLREAHARALGRRWSAFCAIVRPPDHPSRPADYRPLDPFWRKRGYAPVEDAIARFTWREHGETEETEKPLQLWMRAL